MSIIDLINDRSGRDLFYLLPYVLSSPVLRTMIVSADIYDVARDPSENKEESYRFGRLRGDLDAFTEGRMISIAENPYSKPKSAYMSRTDPVRDEMFEIRSRDPRPGIRVFGYFADKDVFVALTWRFREELGGPESNEWKEEIRRCKAMWRKFFNPYPPHKGDNINDYLSDNYFAV